MHFPSAGRRAGLVRLMILSLRTRLIVWHTAIVAAVLLAASVAIYSYLSYSMLRVIDTSLDRSAQTLEKRLKFPDQPPANGAAPIFVPQFVQMITPDGTITDQLRDSEGHSIEVDIESLHRVDQLGTQTQTVTANSGEAVRLVTRRVLDESGRTDFYIRVGQSLDDLRTAQRKLLLLLGAIIPLALLLTIAGGWLMAGRALAPVDRLTRAARSITETRLSERVEAPGSADEIQRLAETFNEMLDRLETAFGRQRQFTADASHEIRTPLAIVRNELDVALRRERTSAEYQETLSRLQTEVVRISRLVEDLLTLARADAGEARLEQEPLPIVATALEVFEQMRPLAEAKGIRATFSAPSDAVLVRGDLMRVKQLLLNLLDNAIKFTGESGEVGLTIVQKAGEVVIEVSDTGRGIEPESQPRIFERFYRQSHTAETPAGSGLGLAICQWIVSAHDGRIEVESEPGKGSCFRVRFPHPSALSLIRNS